MPAADTFTQSFGWRYQVPFLLARGLRVIVPDLVGYGQTDAPQELGAYSYKSVVDDLREVVRHVLKSAGEDEEGKIVLGGHDWYVFILSFIPYHLFWDMLGEG